MTTTLDRSAPIADPMAPSRYRIAHTRQDTRDTFTLELVPLDIDFNDVWN